MRFLFTNLHCNSFIVKPLSYYLHSKPCTYKNKNLLNYLAENNKRIYVYINEMGTSFDGTIGNTIKKSKFLKGLECLLTLKLNGYKISQVKLIFDKSRIRQTDILLSYIFFPSDLFEIEKIKCFRVIDFNHLHCSLKYMSKIKYADCITNVSNIMKDKSVLELMGVNQNSKIRINIKPYSFQKRFICEKEFQNRKNKAIAMGSLCYLDKNDYKKFISIYKINCLHPMRDEIFRRQETIKNYIDSKISRYDEDELAINKNENPVMKFIKKNWNFQVKKYARQKKYHSFDLVELYNDYRIAVVPEEITGLPSMGFVEAMACGCAFMGLNHPMYTDIGMIPNEHYIAYDGTLIDLVSRIGYFQKEENYFQLKKIAEAGNLFVRENLNEKVVAKKFFEQIILINKEYRKNESLHN